MQFAVCLKWVALRPEVDPLTGDVGTDPRFSGMSPADAAALEWALRLAERTSGTVIAVTSGPVEADVLLRDALAVGAVGVERVEADLERSSRVVAADLADACAEAAVVCCGDHSLDRGSGSVPAFLAARSGRVQALGAISADIDGDSVAVERRLDHGRREILRLNGPAVVSFEAGIELRRAPLGSTIAARTASIPVRACSDDGQEAGVRTMAHGPYRPRPRVRPAPVGDTRDRILGLLGGGAPAGGNATRHELAPADAAAVALEHLERWGYLPTEADVGRTRPGG